MLKCSRHCFQCMVVAFALVCLLCLLYGKLWQQGEHLNTCVCVSAAADLDQAPVGKWHAAASVTLDCRRVKHRHFVG